MPTSTHRTATSSSHDQQETWDQVLLTRFRNKGLHVVFGHSAQTLNDKQHGQLKTQGTFNTHVQSKPPRWLFTVTLTNGTITALTFKNNIGVVNANSGAAAQGIAALVYKAMPVFHTDPVGEYEFNSAWYFNVVFILKRSFNANPLQGNAGTSIRVTNYRPERDPKTINIGSRDYEIASVFIVNPLSNNTATFHGQDINSDVVANALAKDLKATFPPDPLQAGGANA